MEEKISSDLKHADLRIDTFRRSLNQLHDFASTLVLLNLQWKDVEDHFDSIHNEIQQRLEELHSVQDSVQEKLDDVEKREDELSVLRESAEERLREVEAREKEFELIQENEIQEMKSEFELIEKSRRELEAVGESIETKSRLLAEKEERLGLLNNSVDEKARQVKETENKVSQAWKEIEIKEKQCAQFRNELKLKEEQIEERSKLVALKDDKFSRWALEFKSKGEELEEKRKEWALEAKKLELKEKLIQERCEEVELEKKKLMERCEKVELKDKLIEDRCEEVELEKKKLMERCQEVEMKEKLIQERYEEVELEKKKLMQRCQEVEMKEKLIQERYGEVETEKEKLMERCKEVELKETLIQERHGEVETEKKTLMERCEEVELKEKLIQERYGEVELEKKKLMERCEEVELNKKLIQERCEEMELEKEKLMERCEEVELKKKLIQERCAEVELEKEKLMERCEEVELKEKLTQERCEEVELEKQKLMERREEVQLKEKQLDEQCREFELKEKKLFDDPPKPFAVNFAKDNPANANVHFIVSMDGKALQFFLNEHCKEYDSVRNDVVVALGLSSDPAKLVLDAIQGFYPPHLKNGDKEFETEVIRRSCILLLEQLMKISTDISLPVKKEAMRLAFDWITKLKTDAEHSLEVLGFLQLLASYGLASAFDADELLVYLEIVAQHSQAPELFRVLGFADKVSGFIQSLIRKKQQVEAIRFIHAFELVNKFSPVTLLNDFIKASKSDAKKLRKTNKSLFGQILAANKRIADLRRALRCIEECKITYIPSVKNLKQAVECLEKENSKRKAEAFLRSRHNRNKRLTSTAAFSDFPVLTPVTLSASSHSLTHVPKTTSDNQLQQLSRNKRPRIAELAERSLNTCHGDADQGDLPLKSKKASASLDLQRNPSCLSVTQTRKIRDTHLI